MRRDSKIAIVVAVIVVGSGVFYLFSGDKPGDQPTAKNVSDADQAKTDKGTPVVANKPGDPKSSLVTRPLPAPTNPLGAPGTKAESPYSSTATPAHNALPSPRPRPADGGVAENTTPGAAPSPVAPVRPSNIGTDSAASAARIGPVMPSSGDATAGIGVRSPMAADTATRPAVALPSSVVSGTTPAIGSTDKAAVAVASSETIHVIKPGDTFSALAIKYLGNAKYANKIVSANPDLDPRRLQLGTKIKIPVVAQPSPGTPAKETAVASPAPAGKPNAAPSDAAKTPVVSAKPATPVKSAPGPVPSGRSYTVKAGDGWYTLAEKFLKDGNRWTELFELNKGRVPLNFHNLPVGTVIEVPADVKQSVSAK